MFSFTKAQQVMMEEKPDQGVSTKFGPNQKYFIQFTLGAGSLLGTGNSKLSINDIRSNDFNAGFKFKRKISGLFSIWLQPEFHYAAFNINQSDSKSLTDSLFGGNTHIKHQNERFATEALALNVFIRINFDPNRGNFLGYYLDLGARGDLNIGREYLIVDNKPDGSVATTNYTGVPYINTLGYNAFAKIGINWLAVTFNYRLSSLFKSQYNFPEPPVYTIGLEINPYSH